MRASSILSAFCYVAAVVAQWPASPVDAYVAKMSPIAKAGVLANIGPLGSKSSGAKAGVVIASPSTHDPDYLYSWVRDSSLVFKAIIDQYIRTRDKPLRILIDQFVAAEAIIQQVPNPSGNITTGGLGEPKFNIDHTAFTGGWGRPQRDGPPLRATALITYANWLIASGNATYVKKSVWPVIKLDLDYTATHWNQSGFDLWEEVSSRSFFTTAVQHRALREGATLAAKIGQASVVAEYRTQAENVLCFLQSYWNPRENYVTSNTGGGRSGKDANSVLASIHTFDPAAGCDAATFQPCSDRALSNLKVYVDSFRKIYTINNGIPATKAVATGRYPEDVYYGGNPWYLTTLAVSEQLYDALYVWKAQGSLAVTKTSLQFFRQFHPLVLPGTYPSWSVTYLILTKSIKAYADDFIAVNAKYTPKDGALAEQYERNTGAPLSARDLTWSYAATLTAFEARRGVVPAGWGAKGLKVPKVCKANPGPVVTVRFNVVAETVPGENIYITGNLDVLSGWSPQLAVPLSSENHPNWTVTLSLPAHTNFEYKYIRKVDGSDDVKWESDPNNQNSTPGPIDVVFVIDDVWR